MLMLRAVVVPVLHTLHDRLWGFKRALARSALYSHVKYLFALHMH